MNSMQQPKMSGKSDGNKYCVQPHSVKYTPIFSILNIENMGALMDISAIISISPPCEFMTDYKKTYTQRNSETLHI
jgi:hypothetical protein